MSRRRWALALAWATSCPLASAQDDGDGVRSWSLHPVVSWTEETGFVAGARLEIVGAPPAARRILLSGQVAQEDFQEFRFSYRTRRFLGTSSTVRFSLGHVDDGKLNYYGLGNDTRATDETVYRGRRSHVTVVPGYRWSGPWETRLRLTLARDEAWRGDAHLPGLEDVSIDHGAVGVALVYDTRNVEWEPSAGRYGTLELGHSLPASDADYVTLNADARTFRAFDDDGRWVLAMRVRCSLVDGEDLPFVLLPTYGGSRARGLAKHRFRGAGVLQGTAEVRWKVLADWGLVAFVDAGRVGPHAGFAGEGGIHPGVGGGVRHYPGARAAILRADVGYGGAEEGAHAFVGFGHAF